VSLFGASLGPWVERTAVILCKADASLSVHARTKQLFGNYAMLDATLTIGIMTVGTVCLEVLKAPVYMVVASYGVGCLIAAALLAMCREVPTTQEAPASRTVKADLKALGKFYIEPRAWLLAFMPLTLGAFSSWKGGTIALAAKVSLGPGGVAGLNLIQKVALLLFAKANAMWMKRFSSYPILVVASLSMLASVLFFYVRDVSEDGWWTSVFFVFAGIGWAAYETATRAQVVEHFRGEQTGYAFSAMTLEIFLVQAAFYPSAEIPNADIIQAAIVAVLACLVVPGSVLADRLLVQSRRRQDIALQDKAASQV